MYFSILKKYINGEYKLLKLQNIKKIYQTGAETVHALRGVSLEFRKSEFVSILGPSGCGKTTLLNIIGGLDHYTDGDLMIKGKSTKKYKDGDWDAYRNHSVGFVFQNYNLIPHQTVLANVEIALTLSGVSKKERRRRAEEALIKVGLGDQLNKKPNQMSGGQMQRVAIARAIVNDPEILLADEPTGALDTETSVQVMEILKEIAKDRLVIMVTHNPELAEVYSTRIIKLIDGQVISDSAPYTSQNEEVSYSLKKNKSMSFFTALGLSVNNLLTKKGRTVMTCFAGSIGIIGIALILSVSNGVNVFIDKVQEDTLSKYPLTIESETVDMSLMLQGAGGENADAPERELDKVYSSDIMYKLVTMMTTVPTSKNNLTDFKNYIDSSEEFNKYASAIKYTYNIPLNFYIENPDGDIVKADTERVFNDMYKAMGMSIGSGSASSSLVSTYSSMMKIWEEMLSGEDGELVNPMLKEQYDLVSGDWPTEANQVVLVINERNELSDFVLYALGLKSSDELAELMKAAMDGKELESTAESWSYEEICGLKIRLILSADTYQKQLDGTYIDLSSTDKGLEYLFNDDSKYTEIEISGIIKPNDNALFSMISGAFGYTSALTEQILERTENNPLVLEQLENTDIDIFSSLPFKSTVKEPTSEEKITAAKEYFAALSSEARAEIYKLILSVPSDAYVRQAVAEMMKSIDRETAVQNLIKAYAEQMGTTDTDSIKAYFDKMSDDDVMALYSAEIAKAVSAQYAEQMQASLSQLAPEAVIGMFDAAGYTDADYEKFYSLYLPSSVSDAAYDDNIKKLGYVDKDSPYSITIYAANFNDKNMISDLVAEYNKGVSEDDQIKMTDYVKLLMSSVSTVINAISYVLIAFVGISLVVSSIMIGVITNISVLERTKEIGILRAVGASKSDIAHVFNAETFIIGLLSGLFGIGITLLFIIPINIILHALTDIAYLSASLPIAGAVILVLLSMLLTIIAGVIPSRAASKKDPVVALRSDS